MKNRNLFLFIFSLLNILLTKSYIILPFSNNNINNNNNKYKEKDFFNNITLIIEDFEKNYTSSKINTIVSMGTPLRSLTYRLNSYEYPSKIVEGCEKGFLYEYNFTNSKTIKYSQEEIKFSKIKINKTYIEDKITLYSDINLKNNQTIKDFTQLYHNKTRIHNNNNICGIIGMAFKEDYEYPSYGKSFTSILKSKNLINDTVFGINIFYDDKEKEFYVKNYNKKYQNYDGFVVYGENTNNINNNFNNNFLDYETTNTQRGIDELNWIIKINKAYYNFHEDNDDKANQQGRVIEDENFWSYSNIYATISIKDSYVYSTSEYMSSISKTFFKSYLENKICFITDTNVHTHVIYCDKDKFTEKERKKFPSLYLKSFDLKYIFELNYKDLFDEIDGKIFFLIMCYNYNEYGWTLGQTFLKKYKFNFNYNKGSIGFYKLNGELYNIKDYKDNKGDNKIFSYMLIFILIIISGIIGIFIGFKIIRKQRKIKANELEENFEYLTNENNIYFNGNNNNNISN